MSHKKISFVNYKGTYNRKTVEETPNALFLFSDNTNRDSGAGIIPADSPYAKTFAKDGRTLHFPQMTSACIRGLVNALPVTMQHYYDKEKNIVGEAGRWHDSDLEEFTKVLEDDVARIKLAIMSNGYDTVVLPENGFSGSKISAITKERTPLLFNIYLEKMKDLTDFIKSRNESAIESVLPGTALAEPERFYKVFRTYANARGKDEIQAVFKAIGGKEEQAAFGAADPAKRGEIIIKCFSGMPQDLQAAVLSLWDAEVKRRNSMPETVKEAPTNTAGESEPVPLTIFGKDENPWVLARNAGGICTIRTKNGNPFGNPFSHLSKGTDVHVHTSSVRESVEAYTDWLTGADYRWLLPERRQEVLKAIMSGRYKGKPVYYYTDTVPDGSYGQINYDPLLAPNHAHVLAHFIARPEELRKRIYEVEKVMSTRRDDNELKSLARTFDSDDQVARVFSMEGLIDKDGLRETNPMLEDVAAEIRRLHTAYREENVLATEKDIYSRITEALLKSNNGRQALEDIYNYEIIRLMESRRRNGGVSVFQERILENDVPLSLRIDESPAMVGQAQALLDGHWGREDEEVSKEKDINNGLNDWFSSLQPGHKIAALQLIDKAVNGSSVPMLTKDEWEIIRKEAMDDKMAFDLTTVLDSAFHGLNLSAKSAARNAFEAYSVNAFTGKAAVQKAEKARVNAVLDGTHLIPRSGFSIKAHLPVSTTAVENLSGEDFSSWLLMENRPGKEYLRHMAPSLRTNILKAIMNGTVAGLVSWNGPEADASTPEGVLLSVAADPSEFARRLRANIGNDKGSVAPGLDSESEKSVTRFRTSIRETFKDGQEQVKAFDVLPRATKENILLSGSISPESIRGYKSAALRNDDEAIGRLLTKEYSRHSSSERQQMNSKYFTAYAGSTVAGLTEADVKLATHITIEVEKEKGSGKDKYSVRTIEENPVRPETTVKTSEMLSAKGALDNEPDWLMTLDGTVGGGGERLPDMRSPFGILNSDSYKDAVEKYVRWLRCEDYLNVEPERRNAIIRAILSGSLAGKVIVRADIPVPDTSYGEDRVFSEGNAPSFEHALASLATEPVDLYNRITYNTGVTRKKKWTREMVEKVIRERDYRRHGRSVSKDKLDYAEENRRYFSALDAKEMLYVLRHLPFAPAGENAAADKEYLLCENLFSGDLPEKDAFIKTVTDHRDVFGVDEAGAAPLAERLYADATSGDTARRKAFCQAVFNALSDDTLRGFSLEDIRTAIRDGAAASSLLSRAMKAVDVPDTGDNDVISKAATAVLDIERDAHSTSYRQVCDSQQSIQYLLGKGAPGQTEWIREEYASKGKKEILKGTTGPAVRDLAKALADGDEVKTLGVGRGLVRKDIEALRAVARSRTAPDLLKEQFKYLLSGEKERAGMDVPEKWDQSPLSGLSPEGTDALAAVWSFIKHPSSEPEVLYYKHVIAPRRDAFIEDHMSFDEKIELAARLISPDTRFAEAPFKEKYLRGSLAVLGTAGSALRMEIDSALNGPEKKQAKKTNSLEAFYEDIYRTLPLYARVVLATESLRSGMEDRLSSVRRIGQDTILIALKGLAGTEKLPEEDKVVMASLADGWEERAAARGISERDYLMDIVNDLSSEGQDALTKIAESVLAIPKDIVQSEADVFVMDGGSLGNVEYAKAAESAAKMLHGAGKLSGVFIIGKEFPSEVLGRFCKAKGIPVTLAGEALPARPKAGQPPVDYTDLASRSETFTNLITNIADRVAENGKGVLVIGDRGRGADNHRIIGAECVRRSLETEALTPWERKDRIGWSVRPEETVLSTGRDADDPDKTVTLVRGTIADVHFRSDGVLIASGDALLMQKTDTRAQSGLFPELLAPDLTKANWGEVPVFREGVSSSVEQNITNNENDADYTAEFHLQKRSFLPGVNEAKSLQIPFRLPDLKANPDNEPAIALENETLIEEAAKKNAEKFVDAVVKTVNRNNKRSVNIFFTGETQPMLEYTVRMNKGASEGELDGVGVSSRLEQKDAFDLRQSGLYEIQETGFRQEHMELYARVFLSSIDGFLHEQGLSIGDVRTTGDSGVGVAFDYAAQRLRGHSFSWKSAEGVTEKGVHDWQHHICPPKGWRYSVDASFDKRVELRNNRQHFGLTVEKLEGSIDGLSVSGSANLFKHRYFAGYRDNDPAEDIDARNSALDAKALDRETLRTANGVRPLGDEVLMALRRLGYSDTQVRDIVNGAAPAWLAREGNEAGVNDGNTLESLLRFAATYAVADPVTGTETAIGTPMEVSAEALPAIPMNTKRKDFVDLRPSAEKSGPADGPGDLDTLLKEVRSERESLAAKGERFVSLSSEEFPAVVGSFEGTAYTIERRGATADVTPGGAPLERVTVDRPLQGTAVEALRLLGYRGNRLGAMLKYAAPAYAKDGVRIDTGYGLASFLRFAAGYVVPGGDKALGVPDGIDDRLLTMGLSGSLQMLFKATDYAPDAGETALGEKLVREGAVVVEHDELEKIMTLSGNILEGVLEKAARKREKDLALHRLDGLGDGEYLAAGEERRDVFSVRAEEIPPVVKETVQERRIAGAPAALWIRGDATLLSGEEKRVSLIADRPEAIRESVGGGTFRETGRRLAEEGVVLVAPDVYSPEARAVVEGCLAAGGRVIVVSPHAAGKTTRPFMGYEELDEAKRLRESRKAKRKTLSLTDDDQSDQIGVKSSYAEDTPMAFEKGGDDTEGDDNGPEAGETGLDEEKGGGENTESVYDKIIENGGAVVSLYSARDGQERIPLAVRERTAMMTSALLGTTGLVLHSELSPSRTAGVRELATIGGRRATFVLGGDDEARTGETLMAVTRSTTEIPSFRQSTLDKPHVDTVLVFPFNAKEPSWHPYGEKDYRKYFKYDPARNEGRSGYAYAFPTGDDDIGEEDLRREVARLYEVARSEPDKSFCLAFPAGMTIPGIDRSSLMKAFLSAGVIPENIRFPERWAADESFVRGYDTLSGRSIDAKVVDPYRADGKDGMEPLLDTLDPGRAALREGNAPQAEPVHTAPSVLDSNRLEITALRKGDRLAFLVDAREKNAVATIRKIFGNDVLICPADNAGRKEAERRLDSVETYHRFSATEATEIISVDAGGQRTPTGLLGESVREMHFLYGRGLGLFRPEDAPTSILYGQNGNRGVRRAEIRQQKRLFEAEVAPRIESVMGEFYGDLGLDPAGKYRFNEGIYYEKTPEQFRFYKDGGLVATVGLDAQGLVVFENKTGDLYNVMWKDNYGMSADKDGSRGEPDDGDHLSFEDGGRRSSIARSKGTGTSRPEGFWATETGDVNGRSLRGYEDRQGNRAKELLDAMVGRLKTVLADNFNETAEAVNRGIREGLLPAGEHRREAVPFLEKREANIFGHLEVTDSYAADGARLVRVVGDDGKGVLQDNPLMRTAVVSIQDASAHERYPGDTGGVYVGVDETGERISVYDVKGTLVSRLSATQVGETEGKPSYAIRDEVSGLYLGASSKMSSILPEGMPKVQTVEVSSYVDRDGKEVRTLPGFAFTTRAENGVPFLSVMLVGKDGPALARRVDGYTLKGVAPGGFVIGQKDGAENYCVIAPGGKPVFENLDEVTFGNGVIRVRRGEKACNLDPSGAPVLGRPVIDPRALDTDTSGVRYETADKRVVASRILVEKEHIKEELKGAQSAFREMNDEISVEEAAGALKDAAKSDKEKERDMERLRTLSSLRNKIRDLKKRDACLDVLLEKVSLSSDILRDNTGKGTTVSGSVNAAAVGRTVKKLRKVNEALESLNNRDKALMKKASDEGCRLAADTARETLQSLREEREKAEEAGLSAAERQLSERRDAYKEVKTYGDRNLCLRQDGLWEYTDARFNPIGKPWESLSEPGMRRFGDGVMLAMDGGHRMMLLAADGRELLPAMADRIMARTGHAIIYRTDNKGNRIESLFDYSSRREVAIKTTPDGMQVILGADGKPLAEPAVTIDTPNNGVVSLFRTGKDGEDVRSWLSLDSGKEYRICRSADGVTLTDKDGNTIHGLEKDMTANEPEYGVITINKDTDTTDFSIATEQGKVSIKETHGTSYFSVVTGRSYPSMTELRTAEKASREIRVPVKEEAFVEEKKAALEPSKEEQAAEERLACLEMADARIKGLLHGLDDRELVLSKVAADLDALEKEMDTRAAADIEADISSVLDRLSGLRRAAADDAVTFSAALGSQVLEAAEKCSADAAVTCRDALHESERGKAYSLPKGTRSGCLEEMGKNLSSVEAGLSDSITKDRWVNRDYLVDGERYQIAEAQGEKFYDAYWKTYQDVDIDALREKAGRRAEQLEAALKSVNAVNPVTELVRTKLPEDYAMDTLKVIDRTGTLAVATVNDWKYVVRMDTRELLAGPFLAVGMYDRPGVEGFCSVKTVEGEYNFLNKEGSLMMDKSYKEISTPGCGLVKVGKETENGMRYNFVDINTGRTISSEWYVNGIEKGVAPDEWNVVESPGDDHEPRFNFINYQGKLMFNSPVDSAKEFRDHTGYIRVANAWRRINEAGKTVAILKHEPGTGEGMGESGVARKVK